MDPLMTNALQTRVQNQTRSVVGNMESQSEVSAPPMIIQFPDKRHKIFIFITNL